MHTRLKVTTTPKISVTGRNNVPTASMETFHMALAPVGALRYHV